MPAVFESAFGSITLSPTSNVPAAIESATDTGDGCEVWYCQPRHVLSRSECGFRWSRRRVPGDNIGR